MKYSFNMEMNKESMAFAQRYDVNASYKDLGAVCTAIRYMKASAALILLDKISDMEMPILYKRHNKHMGARHELHGRKGAYPVKAAREVKTTLVNAIANANNNALDGEEMTIIHACANKTHIERRQPSKGGISWGRGMYGRSAMMHSDIEYAKIEIALAEPGEKEMTKNMKYFIGKKASYARMIEHTGKHVVKKPEAKKDTAKKKDEKKAPEKKPAQVASTTK